MATFPFFTGMSVTVVCTMGIQVCGYLSVSPSNFKLHEGRHRGCLAHCCLSSTSDCLALCRHSVFIWRLNVYWETYLHLTFPQASVIKWLILYSPLYSLSAILVCLPSRHLEKKRSRGTHLCCLRCEQYFTSDPNRVFKASILIPV